MCEPHGPMCETLSCLLLAHVSLPFANGALSTSNSSSIATILSVQGEGALCCTTCQVMQSGMRSPCMLMWHPRHGRVQAASKQGHQAMGCTCSCWTSCSLRGRKSRRTEEMQVAVCVNHVKDRVRRRRRKTMLNSCTCDEEDLLLPGVTLWPTLLQYG